MVHKKYTKTETDSKDERGELSSVSYEREQI